jgi:septum formation protein
MDLSNFKIILGSASPRRKQLLEALGWDIEVKVRNTDEAIPPNLSGSSVAIYLAEKKAEAFEGQLKENELLITSDTIVCKEDAILNKPADKNEAFEMLKTLSGTEHQVYTGVCLMLNGQRRSFAAESTVHFRELNDRKIEDYIDRFEPFDKAGSYGAQECLPEGMNPCSKEEQEFINKISQHDYFQRSLNMSGKQHVPLIKKIEGSYFNVMGLPVATLWDEVENIIKS